MNKYIYLMTGFLMLSAAATAGECVGGTWITANSLTNNPNGNCTAATCNGATFCKSNGTMNWWSAFTWCASNGLTLAKFQDMCPGIPTSSNSADGTCPNLQGTGSGWGWSEMGTSSNGKATVALAVNLSDGSVTAASRDYGYYGTGAGVYAFCK